MTSEKRIIGPGCPGCAKVFKTPWATWCHIRKKHPELRSEYFFPKSENRGRHEPVKIGRPRKLRSEPPKPAPTAAQTVMPLNYCPCCGTNLAVIATVLATAGKVVDRG